MADRTVSVSLLVKAQQFVGGFKQAARSVGDFTDKLITGGQKHRQAINDLAGGAAIVGGAMVGAAVVAVKAFADFDKAMSGVQASTHESAANMDLLREAALEAGERTVYSATEAAAAIESLAKAGVSTTDILGGGLNGALDLAAAGEIAVADAADTAATAMTQFGLSGDKVPHIADLLAAAAGKAQGGVDDMSAALKQSGLVASQFGLTIEESIGTLAAFASAGLTGSDAGTSFKTMLLALANPAEKTKQTMQELGLAAYDAQGNFVGIASLAQQLKEKLEPLPQAQRDAALAQIFGNDAVRAANVLLKEGATGIDEWIGKVNDQGYAAETAATRLDNLAGDMEAFMGSLETALIGVGEGSSGPLRDLVQSATDAVNAFNDLPDGVKSATLAIVGGGGLVLLGAAGLGKLITVIGDTKAAFSDLGLTAGKVAGAARFGVIVGAVIALGTAASEVGEQFGGLNEDVQDVANSLEGFATKGKLTGAAAKLLGDDFGQLVDYIARLGDPSGFEKFSNFAGTYISPFRDNVDLARMATEKMDEALVNLASSGGTEDAAAAFAEIAAKADAQGVSVEKLRELFPQYTAATRSAKDGQDKLAESTEGVKGSTESFTEDAVSPAAEALKAMDDRAQGLIDSLELLNATMGNVDAESAYEEAIDNATDRVAEFKKEQGDAKTRTDNMKSALDLGTKAGRDNAASLRDLWSRTSDYSSQVLRTTGDQKAANGVLASGRTQLVNVAAAFLGSREAAEKYVSEVLGIPPDVSTAIKQPGMGTARSNAQGLDSDYGDLPRSVSTTTKTPGLSQAVNNVEALILGIRNIPSSKTTRINYVETRTYNVVERAILGKAAGGPVYPGSPYIVGENGPELFSPSMAGRITPTSETRQLLASNFQRTPGSVAAAASAGGAMVVENHIEIGGEVVRVVRTEITGHDRDVKRSVMAGVGRNR